MDLIKFRTELVAIEETIKSKGLSSAAEGHVNWCGEKVSVRLCAHERPDPNGYWRREKEFTGPPEGVDGLLRSALEWAYAIPNEEDRAVELMIQKLTEIADRLPKGGSDIAANAWREVHSMLTAKAERLAKNGLPSPNSISTLRA